MTTYNSNLKVRKDQLDNLREDMTKALNDMANVLKDVTKEKEAMKLNLD